MNNTTIIKTEDGSHTLFVPELNEHYHSVHGAINESQHIFIQNGLKKIMSASKNISILEIGFGTGLNAFLTAIESEKNDIKINYTAIEKYPLDLEKNLSLNYPQLIENNKYSWLFEKIITANWNKQNNLTDNFSINKISLDAEDYLYEADSFHLVYFDAFSPDVQPELWSEKIFRKIFLSMKNNSIFVTYSCKGIVKRALKVTGFEVVKLPGPIGKREILNALKIFKT